MKFAIYNFGVGCFCDSGKRLSAEEVPAFIESRRDNRNFAIIPVEVAEEHPQLGDFIDLQYELTKAMLNEEDECGASPTITAGCGPSASRGGAQRQLRERVGGADSGLRRFRAEGPAGGLI